MSITKIHLSSALITFDRKLSSTHQLGDMVRDFYNQDNIGLVVEILEDESKLSVGGGRCRVLWNSDYRDPWGQVIRPSGMNYIQLSKDLFPIQPMPPSAAPFYFEYITKKNTEEP